MITLRRLLFPLLLLAGAARAAEVTTSFSQTGTNLQINLLMTNNDVGAMYNSAELRLETVLGPLVDAVVRFKPGYSTRAQVYSSIGVNIRPPPTGEVYLGWEKSLNSGSGTIAIANIQALYGNAFEPDVDYEVWRDSHYTGPYPILNDMMAVTLNLGGLLDFDGNGQLDDAERLLTLPALTAAPAEGDAGFVGIEGITRYPAAVNRFAVAGECAARGAAGAALTLQRSGADAVLTWQAQHGLSYELQTSLTLSANPADWTPLSTQQRANIPGPELAPQTHTHSAAFTTSPRFYRLRITAP